MKNYSCWYQARRFNATGRYEPQEVVVTANTVKEAMQIAFDKLHELEYETFFPIKCNDLSGNKLREAMALASENSYSGED